jgi:hypothetical protein
MNRRKLRGLLLPDSCLHETWGRRVNPVAYKLMIGITHVKPLNSAGASRLSFIELPADFGLLAVGSAER